MRELSTQIEFDGTPDEVWEVLQDLSAHTEWNPFITKIDGELRPGAKLEVRLSPEGERGITMHPTVLAVEPVPACLAEFVRGDVEGDRDVLARPVARPLDRGGKLG